MTIAISDPETTSAAALDLASVPGTWFLACVQSRKEKFIAEKLTAFGLGVYLPTITSRQFYRRKVVDLELAACPGYLFVALQHDAQYGTALYTKGVFELLPEPRQARLVKQMQDLQRTIASDQFQGMDEWREGRAVRIRDGHNLAGVVGWLHKRRDKQLVQVGYPLMGLVAVVEVDAVFVEPL